jgi:hypothetical protein
MILSGYVWVFYLDVGEHGVGTSMLCYGFPIIGAYWHIVDRSDHWNHIGVLCVLIEFPWISTLIEYICPPVKASGAPGQAAERQRFCRSC